MNAGKIAAQAMRSAGRYRARVALMMLGIVVGISSLAVLTSVGEATKRQTMERIKNMIGTFDTIIVRPGGGRSRGMPTLVNVPATLTFDDAHAIASGLAEIKSVAEVQDAFDVDVQYRDRTTSPGIFGVSPNWLTLRSEDVADGAFFSAAQNESLARVAVLGSDVRTTLFVGDDAIGKTIRIANAPFQVIGVLKARGAGPTGGSLDNIVLVPVRTSARRLFNREYLTMLIAQVRDPERSREAVDRVSGLLRERHHIVPPALDDFTITDPAAIMAQVTLAGSTLGKILTGISVMALLIGGIVIMALMSISVSERRKEIGVRRAVGATRAHIVQQFLCEAVMVAFAGGLIGVFLGIGGMQAVARMQRLPQTLLWRPIVEAVLVALGTGILFGIYPAWKASRVDPIHALRS